MHIHQRNAKTCIPVTLMQMWWVPLESFEWSKSKMHLFLHRWMAINSSTNYINLLSILDGFPLIKLKFKLNLMLIWTKLSFEDVAHNWECTVLERCFKILKVKMIVNSSIVCLTPWWDVVLLGSNRLSSCDLGSIVEYHNNFWNGWNLFLGFSFTFSWETENNWSFPEELEIKRFSTFIHMQNKLC